MHIIYVIYMAYAISTVACICITSCTNIHKCTLYSVQLMYIVYTIMSIHYTVYTIHYAIRGCIVCNMYTVHCTVYIHIDRECMKPYRA